MFLRHIVRTVNVNGPLTFSRRADGAVEVAREGAPIPLSIISANEWASLIATMCDEGEDGRSFRQALAFHTGTAYDPDARLHTATDRQLSFSGEDGG